MHNSPTHSPGYNRAAVRATVALWYCLLPCYVTEYDGISDSGSEIVEIVDVERKERHHLI